MSAIEGGNDTPNLDSLNPITFYTENNLNLSPVQEKRIPGVPCWCSDTDKAMTQ